MFCADVALCDFSARWNTSKRLARIRSCRTNEYMHPSARIGMDGSMAGRLVGRKIDEAEEQAGSSVRDRRFT